MPDSKIVAFSNDPSREIKFPSFPSSVVERQPSTKYAQLSEQQLRIHHHSRETYLCHQVHSADEALTPC